MTVAWRQAALPVLSILAAAGLCLFVPAGLAAADCDLPARLDAFSARLTRAMTEEPEKLTSIHSELTRLTREIEALAASPLTETDLESRLCSRLQALLDLFDTVPEKDKDPGQEQADQPGTAGPAEPAKPDDSGDSAGSPESPGPAQPASGAEQPSKSGPE